MNGYYDYAPTVFVRRHVTLISLITSETRAIAYRVSALSGLRFVDLDRFIEHRGGSSLDVLIRNRGERSYREFEAEALRAALRDSPPAIISLGDGCLIDAASRELVTRHTTLISLDLDLANCLWRVRNYERVLLLRSSREAAARRRPVEVTETPWHPLYGPVDDLDDLRPYYQERRPGLDAAHRRVPARGQSVEHLAERVLEILDQPL